MDLPHFTPDRAVDTERAKHALEAFGEMELPSERDEAWRYTDVSRLDLSTFRPVAGGIEVDGADTDDFGEGAGLVDVRQDVFAAMTLAFGGGVRVIVPRGETRNVRVEIASHEHDAAHLPAL